jgi:hypothetical protein
MNDADSRAIAGLARGGPDLATLADRTDRELAEAKLADRAAVFAAAIEAVRSSTPSQIIGLPILCSMFRWSQSEKPLIAAL